MKFLLSILFFCGSQLTFSQDDLLAEIDTITTNDEVIATFKALKIVNLESTKLLGKKELYLVIAHRFGSIEDGIEGFFGLDNAVTQIKFVYGLTSKFSISAARSEDAYDFSGKYLIIPQKNNGFPFTIVGFNSITISNRVQKELYPRMEFQDKLAYTTQILMARKWNEKLSIEIAPTYFHENFVVNDFQENSQFALGFGGRYKVSKRVSINADYAAHFNRTVTSVYKNPISLGVDVDTGGHVFQMHFTNSQGIHEVGFLGNTTGDLGKGDLFFGFNLIRVF